MLGSVLKMRRLAGGRYVDRTEPVTEIKIYSNQEKETLSVDGKSFETQMGKRYHHYWIF